MTGTPLILPSGQRAVQAPSINVRTQSSGGGLLHYRRTAAFGWALALPAHPSQGSRSGGPFDRQAPAGTTTPLPEGTRDPPARRLRRRYSGLPCRGDTRQCTMVLLRGFSPQVLKVNSPRLSSYRSTRSSALSPPLERKPPGRGSRSRSQAVGRLVARHAAAAVSPCASTGLLRRRSTPVAPPFEGREAEETCPNVSWRTGPASPSARAPSHRRRRLCGRRTR